MPCFGYLYICALRAHAFPLLGLSCVTDEYGTDALIHRYAGLYIVRSFPFISIRLPPVRQRPEDKLPAFIGPDELHL